MTDVVMPNSSNNEATSRGVRSERVANALRIGDLATVAQEAPLIACTYELLTRLGWQQVERDIIDAMPHFSDDLGVAACRNLWVELGYQSQPLAGGASQVAGELFPLIFVSQTGEALLVLERDHSSDQTRYLVYNPALNATEQRSAAALREGVFYLLNNIREPNDSGSADRSTPWFTRLLLRFKRDIGYLFVMSFVLHLVTLAVPFFIMAVYDTVIGAESKDALPMFLLGILAALGVDLVLRWTRAKALSRMAGRVDYLVGVEAYKKVVSLTPLLTERSSVQSQLARLKQFDSVREFFTGTTATLLLDVPFIPVFLLVLGLIAGWMAVIPVVVALIFFLVAISYQSVQEALVNRSSRAKVAQQRFQTQTLDGRNEIAAAQAQTVWMEKYRRLTAESSQANYQASANASRMSSFAQAIAALANVAVLLVGVFMIMAGDLSIGALIGVMIIIGKVLGMMQQVFLNETRLRQTLTSIDQINQLMALDSERSIRALPKPMEQIKGLVQVDKVSFRYSPQADPALAGVSFVAKPGQLIAIAGETGSGKSTLIKMIAGMYRPQSGFVSLDQLDVRQLGGKTLRRSIAYVPQDAQLFHGSLAQNIRLNNPMATDDDLAAAAAAAGILTDIQALPQGFETQVGDAKTEQLTPGFVRGMALARAFVSEAQVILLDEPASHLDRFADLHMRLQLQRLKGRRTVILTTHRPSHIEMADHVIIMERGGVAFSGGAQEALDILKGGGRGR